MQNAFAAASSSITTAPLPAAVPLMLTLMLTRMHTGLALMLITCSIITPTLMRHTPELMRTIMLTRMRMPPGSTHTTRVPTQEFLRVTRAAKLDCLSD